MNFDEVVRRRRMCRSFVDRPIDPAVVDRVLDRARRAPSAGNTQGWAFVVLEGPEQTGPFWRLATDAVWLARPSRPGLLRAPVIIVPLASQGAYLARYAEADKAALGRDNAEGWPAPYWLIDASMATMVLLLAVVDEGLGALLFALHGDPPVLLDHLGVPAGWQPLGAVAMGWPDADDRPSASAARPRRPQSDVIHRGGW
ncbi:MAG: nitroreductase family protein [Acidimicrobiales bacterium]